MGILPVVSKAICSCLLFFAGIEFRKCDERTAIDNGVAGALDMTEAGWQATMDHQGVTLKIGRSKCWECGEAIPVSFYLS